MYMKMISRIILLKNNVIQNMCLYELNRYKTLLKGEEFNDLHHS